MKAKDNPLSVQRVRRFRYQFEDGDNWDSFLSRLESFNFRAAIVGPHGSGKSTLLEDLAPRLADRGFQCKSLLLNEANPQLPAELLRDFRASLTSHDIVLFDGAERLGWLKWRQFLSTVQNGGGLVITVHRPQRLPTLISCRTSPDLLRQMICQLCGEQADELIKMSDEVYKKHNGNLRTALREMYDWMAINSPTCSQANLANEPPQNPPGQQPPWPNQ